MTERLACLICGHDVRRDLEMALVRWRDPVDGRVFDWIPRCLDRDGCRRRCEFIGDTWPVADTAREASGHGPQARMGVG